jgi:hypothetical protein
VFADEKGSFARSDAIQCVNAVLAELGIRTDDKVINFATDPVSNAELQKSLTQLTGGELGWKTLVALYQREASRNIWES